MQGKYGGDYGKEYILPCRIGAEERHKKEQFEHYEHNLQDGEHEVVEVHKYPAQPMHRGGHSFHKTVGIEYFARAGGIRRPVDVFPHSERRNVIEDITYHHHQFQNGGGYGEFACVDVIHLVFLRAHAYIVGIEEGYEYLPSVFIALALCDGHKADHLEHVDYQKAQAAHQQAYPKPVGHVAVGVHTKRYKKFSITCKLKKVHKTPYYSAFCDKQNGMLWYFAQNIISNANVFSKTEL